MRLQRALARAGVASRRGAEALIAEGIVQVNGEVASIGQTVDPDSDVITVSGKRVEQQRPVWMALHKPIGFVVSKSDPQGRQTIFELVPQKRGVTYVGRLDIMTSGLLLLTNDGEYANRLTHPRYQVEKSYSVVARGASPGDVSRALDAGVTIDGKEVRLKRHSVRWGRDSAVKMALVLTEGRNRIVRRLCETIGLEVVSLKRTAHGPVKLGDLAVGAWRDLRPDELEQLRAIGS